jgi:hypothetical protein
MTDQLPTEAVKLSRTDAVALVAQQIADDAAGDVAKCERAVIAARDAFRLWATGAASSTYAEQLAMLAAVAGHANPRKMHGNCTFRMYEDGTDSGDVAEVIFSDHQQTYEARCRMTVSVPIDAQGRELLTTWAEALADLKNARARDLRVGAMKREARDALIKAALNESSEGQAVVDSIKALAAAMRGKVS